MPSERFISFSTLLMDASTTAGSEGSSRCAVPLPPPPWMLLMRPGLSDFMARMAAAYCATTFSRVAGSERSAVGPSSDSTQNGGVGAPMSWQICLNPIFSSLPEATGSVPGHTSLSASTATAVSADSAKADQPGMKTTWPAWRSLCRT